MCFQYVTANVFAKEVHLYNDVRIRLERRCVQCGSSCQQQQCSCAAASTPPCTRLFDRSPDFPAHTPV